MGIGDGATTSPAYNLRYSCGPVKLNQRQIMTTDAGQDQMLGVPQLPEAQARRIERLEEQIGTMQMQITRLQAALERVQREQIDGNRRFIDYQTQQLDQEQLMMSRLEMRILAERRRERA